MPAIFAHRGITEAAGSSPESAARGGRENTLAAFAEARRQGADGVELDARLTSDGVAVVHHDDRLLTGEEIGASPAGVLPGWLPTLADALDACSGLAVNIELKAAGTDTGGDLAEIVARLVHGRWPPVDPAAPGSAGSPMEPARVFVSSFDARTLATVGRAAPELPAGLLVDWRHDPVRALDEAQELGCRSLHPFVAQVSPDLVAKARTAGLALHVWTVNAPADLERMGRLGVAAVITDQVGAAVRILRAGAGSNGGPAAP